MENSSMVVTSFELLWIKEIEMFQYLYCTLFLVVYLSILLMSSLVVFVVCTEESLQEPMYILVCTLALNGMFGSCSFFPKLIFDLLTSSNTISYLSCLSQIYFLLNFTCFEICIFTLMAVDRYLAVCYPLQYVIIMTNEKTLKIITGLLVATFMGVLVAVLLSAKLRLCGRQIQNVFCDNPSIVLLSCTDSTANNLYGTTVTVVFLTITSIIIGYTYLRIFIVCIKLSKMVRNKAMHTLMTHLLNFCIFLTGFIFSFIRYKLNTIDLPLSVHFLFTISRFVFPPFLNPLIYGLRTKALKIKIAHHFSKTNVENKFLAFK
ncbi:olfactory receptor 6N1-like [Pelobates fuscus]|uniref:olfactory receptor 6N1-like n=1 Tax=Pelobates fuscus TaxID=191477 RepID=UPI002FE49BAB